MSPVKMRTNTAGALPFSRMALGQIDIREIFFCCRGSARSLLLVIGCPMEHWLDCTLPETRKTLATDGWMGLVTACHSVRKTSVGVSDRRADRCVGVTAQIM